MSIVYHVSSLTDGSSMERTTLTADTKIQSKLMGTISKQSESDRSKAEREVGVEAKPE